MNGEVLGVFDIVGGPLYVSADDGQTVDDTIAPLLRDGHNVVVSFNRVDTMIPNFFDSAIGQLYGEFTEARIRELLSVRDMTSEEFTMLKRVVDNAKIYFKNEEPFDLCLFDTPHDSALTSRQLPAASLRRPHTPFYPPWRLSPFGALHYVARTTHDGGWDDDTHARADSARGFRNRYHG